MDAKTIRVYWRNAKTGWFNFNWDGTIYPDSVIHISTAEIQMASHSIAGIADVWRYRGLATIGVKNIRPHGPNPGDTITGGVEFYLQIDCNTPINIATDITVFRKPDQTTMV
ncbi:hypothetical protein ACE38W_17765 [Chitinophaga sp. Hz27]|uniref:hypothetical protein n=1 Tax=Chitinophaga sp. Hz27 TaxID=3347169 RepID=UPI0035DE1EE3